MTVLKKSFSELEKHCINDFFYTILPTLAFLSNDDTFKSLFGSANDFGVEGCYEAMLDLFSDEKLLITCANSQDYSVLIALKSEVIILFEKERIH